MGRMIVFTKAEPGREEAYSKWYTEVHLPEVLAKVGPMVAAQRFKVSDAQMMPDQPHTFSAIYEFAGPAADVIAAMKEVAASFDRTEGGAPGTHMVFLEELTDRIEA